MSTSASHQRRPSPLVSLDVHMFDSKLEAKLYTFNDPGAFATVDLRLANGNESFVIKLFLPDVKYAAILAQAINSANTEQKS